MTVYVIGMINIADRARYNRYRDAFMPVLQRYGGRLLAASETPKVEEGSWPYDKFILLSFEHKASYRAWKDSDEYRHIAADRQAASDGAILFVEGFNDSEPRSGGN